LVVETITFCWVLDVQITAARVWLRSVPENKLTSSLWFGWLLDLVKFGAGDFLNISERSQGARALASAGHVAVYDGMRIH